MPTSLFMVSFKRICGGLLLAILAVSSLGASPETFRASNAQLTMATASRIATQPQVSTYTRSLAESKIAFTSNSNGEIYAVNSDGSGLTNLTNSPGTYNWDPSWSPDGSKIAFDSYRNGVSHFEIYVMNADGSSPTQLTFTNGADNPTWSPDGSKIAFSANIGGNPGLYVMRADGTHVARVGTMDGSDPGWSPDGSKLVFESGVDTASMEIYTIGIDGGDLVNTSNSPGADYLPDWSPDGNHIVFISERTGQRQIYTMKPDGSEQTALTNGSAGVEWPSWSPDSQKIVYTSFSTYPNALWVMNANGTGQTQLTHPNLAVEGAHYKSAWSPFIPMAWTVMVYLDGDNSLSSNYSTVFNQLEAAANNQNVNIVVAWDSGGNNDSAYYKVAYDANPTQLADYAEGLNRWNKGELDMSNPSTLSDFVGWSRTNFLAQHYALLISDHGQGLKGTVQDTHTGRDAWMSVKALGNALGAATANGTNKLDVVFADSCLMAMIEDEYQIRNYANFYMASENPIAIPTDQRDQSRPYTSYISGISSSTTPQDLATQIVADYGSWVHDIYPGFGYTLSAVDLTKINSVTTAIGGLSTALQANLGAYATSLQTARNASQKFDSSYTDSAITNSDEYVDLYDLAAEVKQTVADGSVQNAAQTLMDAVSSYALANVSQSGSVQYQSPSLDPSRVHGVSIFFPVGDKNRSFYSCSNFDFACDAVWSLSGSDLKTTGADNIGWGPLIVDYISNITPSAPDDPNPPDLASAINPATPYTIAGSVGILGATVSFTGGSVLADVNGDYSFTVAPNWSGAVTPSRAGYAFTPASRSYVNLTSDKLAQDYAAHTLSTSPYRSNASYDGWVVERSEASNQGATLNTVAGTLYVGDDASRRQYRTILSFATGGLPDNAVITSAKLTLTRQAISPIGTNPFNILQGLLIDIRTGFFGTSASLQATDFQALASKSGIGPFQPTPIGATYNIVLPSSTFSAINKLTTKGGITQVRLRFKLDDNNNNIANYFRFYSGNFGTAIYRPTLTITYYTP